MPQSGKLPRVFVVDDEQIIASTVATILRCQGFDATYFTEPLEALKAAPSETPDLLISDVMMPLLSGIDLAVQLQEFCPKCKVLLFSGQSATAEMLQSALAAGHEFEVLLKPVHPTDLLKKIQSVMEASPSPPAVDDVPEHPRIRLGPTARILRGVERWQDESGESAISIALP
jgi:CheY-like chemotaxis protein